MNTLAKIWQFRDLRNKILVVVGLLLLTRIIAHIPLPGVDLPQLKTFFQQNQAFGLLDMFSGGTMSQFSIILMGVGPYITASIIFQLLIMVIPRLEELQKEGESGQRKINQYMRIATVPLAILQAWAMISLLKSQMLIPELDLFTLSVMLISACAGTLFLMWIGEIISEKGVGNGISLIITIGILSGFPTQIRNTGALISSGDMTKIFGVLMFLALFVVSIAAIIFFTEGQRNVPVSYARQTRQNRMYGSVDSHLPIRVNIAGVIPIIFAMSIMVVPSILGRYLLQSSASWLANTGQFLIDAFQNNVTYSSIYFILVFLFTFFYTSVVFKPDQVAENLQKQGGFVPGLRPGTETRNFLQTVVTRITLVSAIFLAIVAILPYIVQSITKIDTLVLGGTGILIMVSVVIETMRQINSQVVMHTYENY